MEGVLHRVSAWTLQLTTQDRRRRCVVLKADVDSVVCTGHFAKFRVCLPEQVASALHGPSQLFSANMVVKECKGSHCSRLARSQGFQGIHTVLRSGLTAGGKRSSRKNLPWKYVTLEDTEFTLAVHYRMVLSIARTLTVGISIPLLCPRPEEFTDPIVLHLDVLSQVPKHTQSLHGVLKHNWVTTRGHSLYTGVCRATSTAEDVLSSVGDGSGLAHVTVLNSFGHLLVGCACFHVRFGLNGTLIKWTADKTAGSLRDFEAWGERDKWTVRLALGEQCSPTAQKRKGALTFVPYARQPLSA